MRWYIHLLFLTINRYKIYFLLDKKIKKMLVFIKSLFYFYPDLKEKKNKK